MEIWQSASPDGVMKKRMVGRHFDHEMAHNKLSSGRRPPARRRKKKPSRPVGKG